MSVRRLSVGLVALALCCSCGLAQPLKKVPKAPPASHPAPNAPAPAGGVPAAGAPRNLELLPPDPAAGRTVPELRWEAVPGALGYEVLLRRNGKWTLDEEDPNYVPMTTSTSLSGLPSGTVQVAVRAVLASGAGALSLPLQVQGKVAATGSSPAVDALPPLKLPEVDDPDNASSRPARPIPAPPTSAPSAARWRPADTAASSPAPAEEPRPAVIPAGASVTDLVPPPPRPVKEATPKGPPPPAPTNLFAIFSSNEQVRLTWRPVDNATGYVVEEEKDGKWITPPEGVIEENRPSLTLKNHFMPGPFNFRVRAVRSGSRSEPSWPTRLGY